MRFAVGFTVYSRNTWTPSRFLMRRMRRKRHLQRWRKTAKSSRNNATPIENAFRRRIPDLCPKDRDPKLSQKLQAWWLLDFAAFRDEVKKLFKQEIPLAERNEWEAWFDKDKAAIQDLSCQLAGQEQALNREVYGLFGLDAGEIALLEGSI